MKYLQNTFKNYAGISKVLFLFLIVLSSCETTDLDINTNPNALGPDSADPTFILNGIQTSFVRQSYTINLNLRGIVRHVNMFGTYASNTAPNTLNAAWSSTYSIAANTKLLTTQNETQSIANHLGVAQILEAYAYVNIIDLIGSAPFSEAIVAEISSPNFDAGQDVYNALYSQIDEGIANIQASGQVAFEDLFFNGDTSKWVKLANTLKVRMYVQTKLINNSDAASEINSILASGNYITSLEDDFFGQFGTQNDNPDARHPDFTSTYEAGGAGGIYMSNEFMNILLNDKTVEDPRMKYYIYRQTLTDPVNTADNIILPCDGNPNYDLCYIGDFYWGRQHADDEGIPNDNNLRSTFGVYPAGGAYDDGVSNTNSNSSSNLGGAGIHPILTSSFTDFLLAEAALSSSGLSINGDARTYLESAMRKSFSRVETVASVNMNATSKEDYITEVLNNYDNATDDAGRLNVIIKEFYIASFGNSLEAYNLYRRTGFPNLGGSVVPNTDFPRNLLIPESELNTNENENVVQITRTDQVFWDTNPAGFIE